MKMRLSVYALMVVASTGVLMVANSFKPYDEDVWSDESRTLLNEYRLSYFNSLLREFRNYGISRPDIVDSCVAPKKRKEILKKIKRHCELRKTTIFYRVDGLTHTPVYDNRAHKEKPLRKEKCYSYMKQLYKILCKVEQEEQLYKKQQHKIFKTAQKEMDAVEDDTTPLDEASSQDEDGAY